MGVCTMSVTIINGSQIAEDIKAEVALEVSQLTVNTGYAYVGSSGRCQITGLKG